MRIHNATSLDQSCLANAIFSSLLLTDYFIIFRKNICSVNKIDRNCQISVICVKFQTNFEFDVPFWPISLRISREANISVTTEPSRYPSLNNRNILHTARTTSPKHAADCFYVTGTTASRNKRKGGKSIERQVQSICRSQPKRRRR